MNKLKLLLVTLFFISCQGNLENDVLNKIIHGSVC